MLPKYCNKAFLVVELIIIIVVSMFYNDWFENTVFDAHIGKHDFNVPGTLVWLIYDLVPVALSIIAWRGVYTWVADPTVNAVGFIMYGNSVVQFFTSIFYGGILTATHWFWINIVLICFLLYAWLKTIK